MIGIYGGTFDPVHFGHLRPALDVLEGLGLQQVRFIPCGQPPHRQQAVASAEQRLHMLSLAVSSEQNFLVDDREITRPGLSYMVDTLRSLKQDMPEEMFCLIVGMDAFNEFDTWKEWQQILQMVHLIVSHRPHAVFDDSKVSNALTSHVVEHSVKKREELDSSNMGKILFFPVTQLDISSTDIRERVRQKRDIHYLLPDAVIDYIRQQKIYQ